MRSILLSALCAFVLFSELKAQPAPASADEIMKQAMTMAAASKESKNIIVIFHASWCGWCHKMDTAMNDKVCRDFFATNYVVTHMVVDESKDKKNLENPGAPEFRKKYGGEGAGIPYWLVFDKEGNLLADSKIRPGKDNTDGDNTGCPATEKEVDYFINILRKTSSVSDEQADKIRIRFRQNEQ